MRIPRFYFPHQLALHTSVELPAEVFRHAIQVLRLTVGEQLILFNGQGGEYQATLQSVGKRNASVSLDHFKAYDPEAPITITLVQAIIKPDKMDFALQKAVELGVSAIQPLITQRSVVRVGKEQADKKQQHWQGIVTAACEQSGRTRLPTVHAPLNLEDWLIAKGSGTHLILVPGDYPRINALPAQLEPPLSLLIGPEGGFTEEEVQLCLQYGLQGISLGPRILRAETATLAALALLQHHYGDL